MTVMKDLAGGDVSGRTPWKREMTRAELEQSLLEVSRELLDGRWNPRLQSVLIQEFGPLEHAFIVHWTPEQGEDIYTVLVPPDAVFVVELSRVDLLEEPVVERYWYRKWRNQRFGVETRRKLTALEKWMR